MAISIGPDSHMLRLLGGSWVVISGVISRVTILIIHIRGLITPLITIHEPPSTAWGFELLACQTQVSVTAQVRGSGFAATQP